MAEREVRKFTDHFPWSFGGGWVPDEHTPSGGAKLREMLSASPENRDLPLNEEPFKTALDMAEFLDGVPRYPKMHPCGVVLSRQPMHELTATFISNKGYAFCKAHSTAYGVEAYQSAWLKCNYPAEFMAAVLSNGKGFYDPLVYVLESHRLGLKFLPPTINEPGPAFEVHDNQIRVPLIRAKGLTDRTTKRILVARDVSVFGSLADFYRRVKPLPEEMEIMIRAGGFDQFGQTRTRQFWEAQHLHRTFGSTVNPGQGWLLPPPSLERFPEVQLREPTRVEQLEAETELFGFVVNGHPLELFATVDWDSYCPVARLGEHVGEVVVTCGLVVEQRTHHQITGEPMKFLTLADWTGMVETELFATTYRNYGLATVRYPVLEVEATVETFENGRGFSLRVRRAGKPRIR